jgi:hypothetical protein
VYGELKPMDRVADMSTPMPLTLAQEPKAVLSIQLQVGVGSAVISLCLRTMCVITQIVQREFIAKAWRVILK